MNVARVNFSHGTPEYQRDLIRKIKRIRRSMNKPVAILQDLQGPKIRIGIIEGGIVQLQAGQEFILTGDVVPGDAHRASVSLKALPQEVKSGHPILLADGNIELRVEKVVPPEIHCRVIVGGPLSSHKGINLPVSEVHVDSLTTKDRTDIVIGLEEGVDAIALSFVRKASDISACRKVITDHGSNTPIIAKIEKHEAVDNIDSIVAASQAIMVARGDLGVEIDLEKVPLVQKAIIRKCNTLGKPVITATQMLLHMVDNPRPTRAEANDVANAILDGTDAVMLSEETAAGKYPAEAVMMMDRIARSAESSLDEVKFENIPDRAGHRRCHQPGELFHCERDRGCGHYHADVVRFDRLSRLALSSKTTDSCDDAQRSGSRFPFLMLGRCSDIYPVIRHDGRYDSILDRCRSPRRTSVHGPAGDYYRWCSSSRRR